MNFFQKLFPWGQSSKTEPKQQQGAPILKKSSFGAKKGTAKKAKERLQIILSHDRTDISPELMDTLRSEIITVLKKYMEIDETRIEMDIGEGGMALAVNIPVVNVKRGTETRGK